jgi:hypothetical protein
MARFKVTYKNRNRLASVIRRLIRQKGLVETQSLVDSIRISFEQENDMGAVVRRSDVKLRLTINAMYYYLFLDEGASLWNGGVIPPYDITSEFLSDGVTKEVFAEVAKDFVLFIYQQTDKILQIPNPTIEVWLKPIGGEMYGYGEEVPLTNR